MQVELRSSQGSCLGPLSLLDVFLNYLPSIYCYADDTQLYISFSPTDRTGRLDAVAAIKCYIKAIKYWMRENKLLLNEEKTKFLLIGAKQPLAKVNIVDIEVGKINIAPHSPVKNLGDWFDSNLSLVDHITSTSSEAFYYLNIIRRIRKYLTEECTETHIHAFISGCQDSCNSLIFGAIEFHLYK